MQVFDITLIHARTDINQTNISDKNKNNINIICGIKLS